MKSLLCLILFNRLFIHLAGFKLARESQWRCHNWRCSQVWPSRGSTGSLDFTTERIARCRNRERNGWRSSLEVFKLMMTSWKTSTRRNCNTKAKFDEISSGNSSKSSTLKMVASNLMTNESSKVWKNGRWWCQNLKFFDDGVSTAGRVSKLEFVRDSPGISCFQLWKQFLVVQDDFSSSKKSRMCHQEIGEVTRNQRRWWN